MTCPKSFCSHCGLREPVTENPAAFDVRPVLHKLCTVCTEARKFAFCMSIQDAARLVKTADIDVIYMVAKYELKSYGRFTRKTMMRLLHSRLAKLTGLRDLKFPGEK